MNIVSAGKGLVLGLRYPERLSEISIDAAVALFAIAVLLLSITKTTVAFVENANPALKEQNEVLSSYGMSAQDKTEQGETTESIDLTSPQRTFTAVYGGSLIMTIAQIAILAAAMMLIGRFLTNGAFTYRMSLAAVSATAGIEIIQLLTTMAIHLATENLGYGLHAGVFVSPTQSPFLFTWLQRLDVFAMWQYLFIGMGLTSWVQLHKKFGIAVGIVVFAVVQLTFALLTLVLAVVSSKV